MSIKTEFKRMPNGVTYYEDGIHKYTQEEVDQLNHEANLIEEEALKEAIADGFIAFPVYFDDGLDLIKGHFYIPPTFEPSCSPGFEEKHGMKFNMYVPSYGRAGNADTINMLQGFNAENWYVAIDPSQYSAYKEHYDTKHIILRDPSFRSTEKLNMVTSIKSPDNLHGTAGIYNSLLYFSKSMGESHYWTLDDDFIGLAMKAKKGSELLKAGEVYDKDNFYRCSNIKEEYGFSFKKFMNSLEEVMVKMRNPGFLGLEKFGLVFSLPIMYKQTRNYSFYLSSNATQVDHLGQHNNDVITSLENSKHGLANMLFEGICYNSGATQTGGGLTEVYHKFGTLDKGKVLARAQPNYAKINYRYNRVHHAVDYTKYGKQRRVGAAKK